MREAHCSITVPLGLPSSWGLPDQLQQGNRWEYRSEDPFLRMHPKVGPKCHYIENDYITEVLFLVDVSDIFYFFLFGGGGEGGSPKRQEGEGSFFY